MYCHADEEVKTKIAVKATRILYSSEKSSFQKQQQQQQHLFRPQKIKDKVIH